MNLKYFQKDLGFSAFTAKITWDSYELVNELYLNNELVSSLTEGYLFEGLLSNTRYEVKCYYNDQQSVIVHEDVRFLKVAEYKKKVKYRLIPFIW